MTLPSHFEEFINKSTHGKFMAEKVHWTKKRKQKIESKEKELEDLIKRRMRMIEKAHGFKGVNAGKYRTYIGAASVMTREIKELRDELRTFY